jgi:hypothetical protein
LGQCNTSKDGIGYHAGHGVNCIIFDKVKHPLDIKPDIYHDGINEVTAYYAHAISVFEHNGDGQEGFSLGMCKAIRAVDDLQGGGERELVRFFLKRIPCSCLKATYSQIKKSQPIRTGECFTCKQSKKLSSLMICGCCNIVQYCCKECQVAHWPKHKGMCNEFVRIAEKLCSDQRVVL